MMKFGDKERQRRSEEGGNDLFSSTNLIQTATSPGDRGETGHATVPERTTSTFISPFPLPKAIRHTTQLAGAQGGVSPL